MSQLFDLYVPGDSWLHRMDPRAKLWAVLLAGAVGLMFKHIGVLAALLLATHVALLTARVPREKIRSLWMGLVPLLVVILLLQPFFAPGPGPDILSLGPLRLTVEGLQVGLSFALRAAALAFVVAVLLLTTDPDRLVQGMVKLGLPYPWGLTVGLAIRYLPTTFGLFVAVSEAQQARGWIVGEGNIMQRARAYIPILVATIIAALRLGDNLGLALAARGLGYPVRRLGHPARRTTLHDIHFTKVDWLTVGVVTVVFAGLVVLRYGMGLGAEPW